MISNLQIAWLAGIVDGEGCMGFLNSTTKENHHKHQLYLTVQMTDKDTIEKVRDLIGGKIRFIKRIQPHNHIHNIRVTGQQAANWIADLFPYFSVRRKAKALEVLTQFATTGELNINDENICSNGHLLSTENVVERVNLNDLSIKKNCKVCIKNRLRKSRLINLGKSFPSEG